MKKRNCLKAATYGLYTISVFSLISGCYGQTFTISAVPSSLTIYPGQQNVPVTITAEREHTTRSPRVSARSTVTTPMRESSTVYLSLPSGATARFEVGAIDGAFVRALLAELRT